MPWIKESLPRRAWSSFIDFFHRWWKEATLPLGKSGLSPMRAVLRRIMLWVPVAILAGILTGAAGLQFFIGWRARNLAHRAVASLEAGNLPAARVQISSACNLRPNDPEVLRARAAVETKMGFAGAAQTWQLLPADLVLTQDELELRATAMMRTGDDAQFDVALAALEKAGGTAPAAMIRAERDVSRGNLQDAILEARGAVKVSGTPADRLALVRLLLARHVPFLRGPRARPENLAGAKEISGIVDSMEGTKESEQAIALAFGALDPSPDEARRWSAAAWKRPSPDNPALLAASTAMIASGEVTREDMINRLKAVYAGAEPARKAALAAWLFERGDAEGALVYAPPAEATRNASAFLARSAALGALQKWDELVALSEGAGTVPRSLMLAVAAQANAKLGRGAQAQKSAQDAVRAAAGEGTMLVTLGILDESGFRKPADAGIISLCGEAEIADRMLRLARERFGRGGQPASLQAAYERAAAASPHSPTIQDRQRYTKLLSGETVDPQETAAALAAGPTDVNLRFTHALALLKAGRAPEALAVFDDFDVFVEQAPPGQQAVAAAIFAANGDERVARSLARALDPALLDPGEYALIVTLRNEPE